MRLSSHHGSLIDNSLISTLTIITPRPRPPTNSVPSTDKETMMATMASNTEDTAVATCANCGIAEEGENKLKTCTACKMVKYCCRDCQAANWPQHKKACKKRAAELYDEKLFKDHAERDECPICMITMPIDATQVAFNPCCRKFICNGCIHAQTKEDIKSGKAYEDWGACPFCRERTVGSDKVADEVKRCVEIHNCFYAMNMLGIYYLNGECGLPRDLNKAIELFLEAGKLGCAEAYNNLGNIYILENGIDKDVRKAKKYYELAVIGGHAMSRYDLAVVEEKAFNYERSSKHFLIGARAGDEDCLKAVKTYFEGGDVTKDEYSQALQAYHKQKENTKSAMREEAMVYNANPALYDDLYLENSRHL